MINKIAPIIFLLLFFNGLISAQNQQGFRYQALARNANGEIVQNQEIQIRIQLLADLRSNEILYEEIHHVKTDPNGIINTVIGHGSKIIGAFEDISWSSENIWINVSFDFEMENNFSDNYYAQLLAVPYAMYALEAGKMAENNSRGGDTDDDGGPTDKKYWLLEGNCLLDTISNKLGSTNHVDVVFISSDVERARILANGDFEFKSNVNINPNLTVGGTLSVEDVAYFDKSIEVNGDVEVEHNITAKSNVYFYEDLFVKLNTLIEGNLDVNGYGKVNGNFDVVKGKTTLHQELEVLGLSLFSNITNSNSKDDGSIVIEGGVGIEKNVNIGGNFTQDDKTDKVTIGKTLITNEEQSHDKDSGSLVVEGGVGIEKDVWIGGDLNVVGDLKGSGLVIDGARNGPDDEWDSYPVQITGINQGIAVRTLESPDSENNFITFFDENDEPVGRIEGQTKIDILESSEYIVETTFQAAAIASSLGSFASQAASNANLTLDVGGVVVDFANHLLSIVGAAFGAVEGGAGLGDLICVVAIAIIDLAYSTVQLAGGIAGNFIDFTVTAFDATVNIANLIQYQTQIFLNSGSTFSSGSADYAEWLPKANPLQTFTPGDVVGIKNGKIISDVLEADQLMVISSDPIVLGNMPESGDEHLFERVAFMGQVPVKVNGPVKSGDYLVASDQSNGYAKAISPEEISLELVERIVGVSWGSSEIYGTNYVNTAIGLNRNDVVPVLKNQVKEIDKLKVEMNEIKKYILENEAILAELIPGYADMKKESDLLINPDLQLGSNDLVADLAMNSIEENLTQNNIYDLIDGYTEVRRGDSYVPQLDNSQIMSMLNKIDSKHNVDLSIFNSTIAGPFDGIESAANSILQKDFIADFKSAIVDAVSTAVQEVANQILSVKTQMLNDIASGGGLTANEKMMLNDKLNDILPIFGLMENSGQLVSDVTSGIFEIIDEAACAICEELDALPVKPNDIIDVIDIPLSFTFEIIDFFTGTLDDIRNINFEVCVGSGAAELCSPDIKLFENIIPDLNIQVDDFPFVENKQLDIQFPDLCQSINCN